jgi:hypothetical protein
MDILYSCGYGYRVRYSGNRKNGGSGRTPLPIFTPGRGSINGQNIDGGYATDCVLIAA